MNENNKESKPQWKGCIIFGIINIVFVLLCTKLNIIMLNVALILLIAAGVVTGVAAGTATITASITVGGTSYTDTCEVTVTPAAAS